MIGLLGIVVMLGLAVLFSEARSAIKVGPALRTFGLQLAVAVIALATPAGLAVLSAMSDGVQAILLHAQAGIQFVFGPLASDAGGLILAVQVLPIIVFVAALGRLWGENPERGVFRTRDGGVDALALSDHDDLVTLASLDPQPESVPINALVRLEGTPMAEQADLDPLAIVRMVAIGTMGNQPRGEGCRDEDYRRLCRRGGAALGRDLGREGG